MSYTDLNTALPPASGHYLTKRTGQIPVVLKFQKVRGNWKTADNDNVTPPHQWDVT